MPVACVSVCGAFEHLLIAVDVLFPPHFWGVDHTDRREKRERNGGGEKEGKEGGWGSKNANMNTSRSAASLVVNKLRKIRASLLIYRFCSSTLTFTSFIQKVSALGTASTSCAEENRVSRVSRFIRGSRMGKPQQPKQKEYGL